MKQIETHWLEVCSIQDIPVRGAVKVELGDSTIAIFRTIDDQVSALEDRCPHKGGPLSDGIVHGNCVTCPLHNWDISLDTGQAMGADEGQVEQYAVRIKDSKVFLATPSSLDLSVA